MTTAVYPLKVTKFLFKNYCYLVVHSQTREAVLVDPAWEANKIEEQIKTAQADLNAVLLTHHHIDHVNLANHFAKRYNIPVCMSKTEIDFYRFSCRHLLSLENQGELSVGQIKINCHFTPGHTKGAICYHIDKALFTGDTLFIEGCGICFGKGGDPHEMFKSLSHLKKVISPHTLIYPGHSYGKEPGQLFQTVLENNIYLQFNAEESFVAFRMRKKQKGLFNFQ